MIKYQIVGTSDEGSKVVLCTFDDESIAKDVYNMILEDVTCRILGNFCSLDLVKIEKEDIR